MKCFQNKEIQDIKNNLIPKTEKNKNVPRSHENSIIQVKMVIDNEK